MSAQFTSTATRLTEISLSLSDDAEPAMSLGEKSPKETKPDCGKCLKSRVAMASLMIVNHKRKRQLDGMYISSANGRS